MAAKKKSVSSASASKVRTIKRSPKVGLVSRTTARSAVKKVRKKRA